MANAVAHILFITGLYTSMYFLAQSPALAMAIGAACVAIWAVAVVKWPGEPQAAHSAPVTSPQANSAAMRWFPRAIIALPFVAAGISFLALPPRFHGAPWFMLGFGLAFPALFRCLKGPLGKA